MKKTIIIPLAAALVFFTLGYLISAKMRAPAGQAPAGSAWFNIANPLKGGDTFQAGWDAAKKRLAESGFMPIMSNIEIKSISGEVKAVGDKTVTLKIRPLEPLADPNLDERIIEVDANTKIYVLAQKDQALYQKEMAEFNKKMQEQMKNMPKAGEALAVPATSIMPPEFFTKKQASISDIKVGTTVNVVATDKDIKNTKQFSAAEISLQSTSVMTPAAATPLTPVK